MTRCWVLSMGACKWLCCADTNRTNSIPQGLCAFPASRQPKNRRRKLFSKKRENFPIFVSGFRAIWSLACRDAEHPRQVVPVWRVSQKRTFVCPMAALRAFGGKGDTNVACVESDP